MSTKFHQISLKETFSECQDMFIDDAPSFFQLLDEHLDLNSFIPDSFFNAFYPSLGRKRLYPLSGFLAALILQKIFSIPTDSLLILFLPVEVKGIQWDSLYNSYIFLLSAICDTVLRDASNGENVSLPVIYGTAVRDVCNGEKHHYTNSKI